MIAGGAAALLLILFVVSSLEAAPADHGPESILQMIRRVARENGQDEALLLAIAEKESSFVPSATNPNDPSWGLFGITKLWVEHFRSGDDVSLLFNAEYSASLASQIVDYFKGRGFKFPEQADIYNVGETLWARGVRNVAYRNAVKSFYSKYSS